jgi:hypothetical protein
MPCTQQPEEQLGILSHGLYTQSGVWISAQLHHSMSVFEHLISSQILFAYNHHTCVEVNPAVTNLGTWKTFHVGLCDRTSKLFFYIQESVIKFIIP